VKRAVWALVIAVPIVLLLASGFGHDPSVIASPLVGKKAPNFTLRTLDGKPVSLAELRGKPVVLNFWQSFCPSCVWEHPYLRAAWQKYAPHGVLFVGVLYQDTTSDARAYIRKYGGGWPVLRDPGAGTALNYGVIMPPETFFITRSGVVQYKSTGPVTPQLLDRQIDRLLHSHV
jgi:cytochrome c biogenesis protein CcmG/thiol:disulfide interchange protein DsbE